ncbi:MAG TPA: prealbumin-like fold domain-containing protein, partial [Candidatus Limnocylindria bacterium]
AAADEGVGQADCPVGTTFLVNFDEGDLEVDLELATGVFVRALTFDDNDQVTSATIENTTAENITIAVKGGSDQAGNFVTIAPGGTETITVTDNPTISNLSVCQGPELEDNGTLTLDKVTVNGDDEFAFTLGGTALADTLSGADPAVLLASETGTYVVAEALTQAQMDAGWSLTSIDCVGNAIAEVVTDASVSVTVGADEDVVCTFTNTLTENGGESGLIAIFKTMCESIGQQDTCNGRDTSLDGYMIDFEIRAGASADGELIETATVTLNENAEGEGNTGNGSQGRVLSAELEPGTYTVCEIPVAYLLDEGGNVIDEVDLEAVPRPEAGNGGSTGGDQEQIAGTDCVVVEVTAGTAEVKFLDTIADQGEQLGSLLIAKVDADGNLLPGATFTVDGVAHADTDEDGLVCVDGLTLGDMVSIEETVAPEGFVGDDDIEDVEVTSTEDCATRLAAVDPATDADIAVVNAESGVGPEETVEVSIMKHLCTDVASVAEFEAIEAAAAEENPDNAFAPLVATVLACPTIVLTGDIPTEGAVSGGAVDFEFSVVDASGTQLLSEDGTFMQGALCESDVNLDADGDGTIEEDVCLDVSHYSFEVIDGVVVITETDAPDGHRFGTIRFTPGSDDADTLVGSIASVEATGVITLDTTRDEDDTVMVHAYNFVTEGTQGGNPVPNERPREGTLGGNPVPDTAMAPPPAGTIPGSLLALVLLGALGIAGHQALAEARKRS